MSESHPPSDQAFEEAVALGHEPRDIPPRLAIITGAGLAAVMVFGMLGAYWILGAMTGGNYVESIEALPANADSSEAAMRAQRLASLEHQQNELKQYRWLNQQAGVAQIPIARAMELLAEQPELLEGESIAAEASAFEPEQGGDQ